MKYLSLIVVSCIISFIGCNQKEERALLSTSIPTKLEVPLSQDTTIFVHFSDREHLIATIGPESSKNRKIGRYTTKKGWEFAGMITDSYLGYDASGKIYAKGSKAKSQKIMVPKSIAWDRDKLYAIYWLSINGEEFIISTADTNAPTLSFLPSPAFRVIGRCSIGKDIMMGMRSISHKGLLFLDYYFNDPLDPEEATTNNKGTGVFVYSLKKKTIVRDISSNKPLYWTREGIWYSENSAIKLLKYDNTVTSSEISLPVDIPNDIDKEKPYSYAGKKLLVKDNRVYYIFHERHLSRGPGDPKGKHVKTVCLFISDKNGYEQYYFPLESLGEKSFSISNTLINFDTEKKSFIMHSKLGKTLRFDYSTDKPHVEEILSDLTSSHYRNSYSPQYWPITVVEE